MQDSGDVVKLRMRSDGKDCNFALLGAVAPEDPISAGRSVLGVGFKDRLFGIEGIFKGCELVGSEGRVTGIYFKIAETFSDLTLDGDFGLISFERLMLFVSFRCEK